MSRALHEILSITCSTYNYGNWVISWGEIQPLESPQQSHLQAASWLSTTESRCPGATPMPPAADPAQRLSLGMRVVMVLSTPWCPAAHIPGAHPYVRHRFEPSFGLW